MSNGPKPLFEKDDNTKIEVIKEIEARKELEFRLMMEAKGPKPLSFPDQPVVPHVKINMNVNVPNVKPLDLSNSSTPVPHAAPHPSALFDSKPVPYVNGAIKIAHDKFANLGQTNLESVERQIKSLLPLNITSIITWGEPSISQEANLVTKCAALLKQFSELRGAELCESALKASTQAPTAHFWPFTAKGQSVIGFKPSLIALKSQIMSMLPSCDDFTTKMEALNLKLTISMTALSCVCESIGTIEDSSISIAVDNRRRILAQCVQQSDLTAQQLKQMKNLIVDQLSRISQLLDVTIPAIETANATQ